MAIGYYCNREVVVTGPNTSALEAARLMREHHVGTLIVIEKIGEESRPKGIVTDRDLVLEIMAANLSPETIQVSDFMSEPLYTVREDEHVADVVRTMRSHGIRRIVVVNGQGHLEGIVSMDDLIVLIAEEMDEIAKLIVHEPDREGSTRNLRM